MPVISAPYFRRFFFIVIFLATSLAVQSQSNGLLVTYSIKTISRSLGNGDSTATREITDDRRDVQTVSLDLSGSFKISNQGTNRSSYYDLKNEVITVASQDTLYSHLPLHHIIDYRWAEYQNRIYLTNLISKAGVEDPFGGFGNLEMIFGIEFKENKVRESILEKKKKDTTIFEVDGIQIAKIHYAPKPLSPQISPAFSKYLTYEIGLHPSIKEKIIIEQKVPDYIEYFFTHVTTRVTKVMRLESVKAERVSQVYPTVSKLPWKIRHTNSLDRLLDSVSHYTTLHAVAPLDSVQCFSEADQLSKEGNNLSAILRLFEYLLQSGHTPTPQIRKIGAQQNADPILQKFFTCLGQPKTKEEAEIKIKRYRELIALNKKYGYIMNIFLANYLQPIDLNESRENFHVALKHNPFITGAYVDLGKAYANQYDYASAWQCFDIALKLNSNHPMTRGILANKEKLKAEFPQYFNTN